MPLPKQGKDPEALFATLEAFREQDMPWRDGRTWAYVYDPGEEAEGVIKQAFSMYLTENGLDPTVFPSAMHMENEVIGIAADLLHGDENVVGSFTSGGTESIICAVKAARDRARQEKPHVTRPEILLPETAHASFQKAAHYLGLEVVVVPVDPETFLADPELLRAAITPNTVMMVGSAISYAHGVVDPIPELGALAEETGVWLHVDGCMGGFMLHFLQRQGVPIPDYDFRVPGVSSISMDYHKYAFAAKGASVILYRSRDLRRHQMYACSNWTGYTVINPTVQSTKSAGPVASSWAILHHFGDDGYMAIARKVWAMTEKLVTGIDAIPDLRVLGKPQMNMCSFASDTVSVFHVADEMKERGWFVQPQLAYGSSPENLHLSINPASERWADDLIADLRVAVDAARELPSGELTAKIQEAFSGLSADEVTPDVFQGMLGMAGVDGTALPGRMAEINEVLNALPVPLREKLLVEYLNELYQPAR
ncbi:MAG: aspartate aminotransferase family protein [Myxococcota bacterium]|nr:aspartate aminotransferase family protein [Myxococcota bacterium]